MKSTIALLTIAKLGEAVNHLAENGFSERDMNVMVQENVAKVQLGARGPENTTSRNGKSAAGLQTLLSGLRPFNTPEAGNILAAGSIATVLTRTATPSDVRRASGLEDALVDFGVPQEIAQNYTGGISKGMALLLIRTDDEASLKAINILRDHQAQHLITVP